MNYPISLESASNCVGLSSRVCWTKSSLLTVGNLYWYLILKYFVFEMNSCLRESVCDEVFDEFNLRLDIFALLA